MRRKGGRGGGSLDCYGEGQFLARLTRTFRKCFAWSSSGVFLMYIRIATSLIPASELCSCLFHVGQTPKKVYETLISPPPHPKHMDSHFLTCCPAAGPASSPVAHGMIGDLLGGGIEGPISIPAAAPAPAAASASFNLLDMLSDAPSIAPPPPQPPAPPRLELRASPAITPQVGIRVTIGTTGLR